MTYPPALPEARGPNPTRAAFFTEAAGAFEFYALWHSLDAPAQNALRDAIHAAAAASAHRALPPAPPPAAPKPPKGK